MRHTFSDPFLLTRGSVNDIRIFHHTPLSRWQANTYLNMSFSEGKSPGFIAHHSVFHLASAFRLIVNDRLGAKEKHLRVSLPMLSLTAAIAFISLDACGAFTGTSATRGCSVRRDTRVSSVLSPVLVSSWRRRGTPKISESKQTMKGAANLWDLR